MAENRESLIPPDDSEAVEAIKAIEPDLLNELSPDNAERVVRIVRSVTSFQGPIPPPSLLAEFEEVLPGLAKTLVDMAVKEQDHRHSCEHLIVKTETSAIPLGQWLGFVFAIIAMIAGVVLGLEGHDWVAGTIFTTVVIGGLTVFVLGRSKDGAPKVEEESAPKPPPKKSPKTRTGR